MIREDRELLAELARLNRELAPLALRIMDGSAGAAEQLRYAERLVAAGQRLEHRADARWDGTVEGELVTDASIDGRA